MERVQELINVLADRDVIERTGIAKALKRCKICGKPAKSFTTPRSELEYSISLICESCQNYYLGDGVYNNEPNMKSAWRLLADGVIDFAYPKSNLYALEPGIRDSIVRIDGVGRLSRSSYYLSRPVQI